MDLQSLTRPELMFSDVPGSDPPTILQALAESVVGAGAAPVEAKELYAKLWEREELGSTGIGSGIAIPHCKLARGREVVLAVAVSREPVEFDALDRQPVRLFFVLVSPEGAPAEHLKALAAVSRWVKVEDHVQGLLSAGSPDAMFALLGADGTAE
jgi:PTS system nitrogen regulatory IIA component